MKLAADQGIPFHPKDKERPTFGDLLWVAQNGERFAKCRLTTQGVEYPDVWYAYHFRYQGEDWVLEVTEEDLRNAPYATQDGHPLDSYTHKVTPDAYLAGLEAGEGFMPDQKLVVQRTGGTAEPATYKGQARSEGYIPEMRVRVTSQTVTGDIDANDWLEGRVGTVREVWSDVLVVEMDDPLPPELKGRPINWSNIQGHHGWVHLLFFEVEPITDTPAASEATYKAEALSEDEAKARVQRGEAEKVGEIWAQVKPPKSERPFRVFQVYRIGDAYFKQAVSGSASMLQGTPEAAVAKYNRFILEYVWEYRPEAAPTPEATYKAEGLSDWTYAGRLEVEESDGLWVADIDTAWEGEEPWVREREIVSDDSATPSTEYYELTLEDYLEGNRRYYEDEGLTYRFTPADAAPQGATYKAGIEDIPWHTLPEYMTRNGLSNPRMFRKDSDGSFGSESYYIVVDWMPGTYIPHKRFLWVDSYGRWNMGGAFPSEGMVGALPEGAVEVPIPYLSGAASEATYKAEAGREWVGKVPPTPRAIFRSNDRLSDVYYYGDYSLGVDKDTGKATFVLDDDAHQSWVDVEDGFVPLNEDDEENADVYWTREEPGAGGTTYKGTLRLAQEQPSIVYPQVTTFEALDAMFRAVDLSPGITDRLSRYCNTLSVADRLRMSNPWMPRLREIYEGVPPTTRAMHIRVPWMAGVSGGYDPDAIYLVGEDGAYRLHWHHPRVQAEGEGFQEATYKAAVPEGPESQQYLGHCWVQDSAGEREFHLYRLWRFVDGEWVGRIREVHPHYGTDFPGSLETYLQILAMSYKDDHEAWKFTPAEETASPSTYKAEGPVRVVRRFVATDPESEIFTVFEYGLTPAGEVVCRGLFVSGEWADWGPAGYPSVVEHPKEPLPGVLRENFREVPVEGEDVQEATYKATAEELPVGSVFVTRDKDPEHGECLCIRRSPETLWYLRDIMAKETWADQEADVLQLGEEDRESLTDWMAMPWGEFMQDFRLDLFTIPKVLRHGWPESPVSEATYKAHTDTESLPVGSVFKVMSVQEALMVRLHQYTLWGTSPVTDEDVETALAVQPHDTGMPGGWFPEDWVTFTDDVSDNMVYVTEVLREGWGTTPEEATYKAEGYGYSFNIFNQCYALMWRWYQQNRKRYPDGYALLDDAKYETSRLADKFYPNAPYGAGQNLHHALMDSVREWVQRDRGETPPPEEATYKAESLSDLVERLLSFPVGTVYRSVCDGEPVLNIRIGEDEVWYTFRPSPLHETNVLRLRPTDDRPVWMGWSMWSTQTAVVEAGHDIPGEVLRWGWGGAAPEAATYKAEGPGIVYPQQTTAQDMDNRLKAAGCESSPYSDTGYRYLDNYSNTDSVRWRIAFKDRLPSDLRAMYQAMDPKVLTRAIRVPWGTLGSSSPHAVYREEEEEGTLTLLWHAPGIAVEGEALETATYKASPYLEVTAQAGDTFHLALKTAAHNVTHPLTLTKAVGPWGCRWATDLDAVPLALRTSVTEALTSYTEEESTHAPYVGAVLEIRETN